MASMRDIKRRKESVQSTQQITKAMKLVATVKLQKARGKAESNKPYFKMLYKTICSILAKSENIDHEYLKENESNKKAVIAITSNRGLAGGYNSNIVKLIASSDFSGEDTLVYAIGRKGIEGLSRKGYSIYKDYSDIINEPLFSDATALTKELLEQYSSGEIGEIYIAYTNFKNTVTQEPKLVKLLPLSSDDFKDDEEDEGKKLLMNFEPTPEEVLDKIVPKYMSNIIFGAFLESVASENGARMQAMDSATSNADEMISSLSLKYNRARQSAITQELTEIIAGADAIS
ncbi:MAG: ATP synthase F1 subunit gamma [Lachnospiraceae bacterium]|nr:ATP synthase F1 subunit gamma [Lachnospiraceae bacterium]